MKKMKFSGQAGGHSRVGSGPGPARLVPGLILLVGFVVCQPHSSNGKGSGKTGGKLTAARGSGGSGSGNWPVLFYNVQNLFDATHQPGHADYTYLPVSHPKKKAGCSQIVSKYYRSRCFATDWTKKVAATKVRQIARVVFPTNKAAPALVGLAEVENRAVVEAVLKEAGKANEYQLVMGATRDPRGIRVALLARRDAFALSSFRQLWVKDSRGKILPGSRSILVARLNPTPLPETNLWVYVNHWPSQRQPARRRYRAARTIMEHLRSLSPQKQQPAAGNLRNYLILGDFNRIAADNPDPLSVFANFREGGGPPRDARDFGESDAKNQPPGTYFYARGRVWNHLDRIFVSPGLADGKGWDIRPGSFRILADRARGRVAVYSRVAGRTVPRYFRPRGKNSDGFSDHFPVYLELTRFP